MEPEVESGRIKFLVADAGPFIKGAPLQKWSSNVVTVREVIAEIRDKATRERLQILPYELSYREPSIEALQHVTRFAKRTGDYGSLSPVDLKLISLTYQLHCELEPTAQLRKDPPKEIVEKEGPGAPHMVGFYDPLQRGRNDNMPDLNKGISGEKTECDSGEDTQECVQLLEEVETLNLGEKSCEICHHSELSAPTESHDEEEEDDDEGWITPENFQQACEEMGGVTEDLPQSLAVGCVTTDFAMQNVLLQMGLNLISVEGMRIKQLRTYAKKCKGCFKTTTNTGLVWCPWCGNRSLYRVSVVVDSTGHMQYRPLSNKQFSHRGLKYPQSIPKSGRHVHNPVLAPDQLVTHRERRRRGNKVDPLDLDYVAQSSPFSTHDVTSRGARLAMGVGARGGSRYQQRNPNAVRPKGRRKK